MYNFDRGEGEKTEQFECLNDSSSFHGRITNTSGLRIWLTARYIFEGSKYRGQLCVCSTYYLPFTIGFLFTSFTLQSSLNFNYYWKKLLVYIWP